MGTITIKLCPFCGHDDVEIDEVGIGDFSICCPECRAIGPIMGTVMEAICKWNDRSGLADNDGLAVRPMKARQNRRTEHAARRMDI